MKVLLLLVVVLTHLNPSALAQPTESDTPDWLGTIREAQSALTAGELELAGRLFRQALTVSESKGQGEPGVVNCLCGLAQIEDRKGNFQESERLHELAMRTLEQITGDQDNHRYANYLTDLAELYARHGKLDKAELALRKQLDIRAKKPPLDEQRLIDAHEALARLLRMANRADEARIHESQALQLKFRRESVSP